MNKFTGAKNLTERDVQNIEKMCAAGMDLKTVSDITGWGREVCRKIRKGNYWEMREKNKAQAREKAATQQPSAELEALPVREAMQVIKNIYSILLDIDCNLIAICNELGVPKNEKAE